MMVKAFHRNLSHFFPLQSVNNGIWNVDYGSYQYKEKRRKGRERRRKRQARGVAKGVQTHFSCRFCVHILECNPSGKKAPEMHMSWKGLMEFYFEWPSYHRSAWYLCHMSANRMTCAATIFTTDFPFIYHHCWNALFNLSLSLLFHFSSPRLSIYSIFNIAQTHWKSA